MEQTKLFQVKTIFAICEEETTEEVENLDSIKQQIASLEKLVTSSQGKMKDNIQMQLNRLKTKLATVRTNAVLNNCLSIDARRHVQGRRSASRNRPRNSPRFSTPISRTTTQRSNIDLHENITSEKRENKDNDSVIKEINLIKARLLEK